MSGFDINYLGHNFEKCQTNNIYSIGINSIGINYKCKTCEIMINYLQGSFYECLLISSIFANVELILNCDECVVKNIIE